MCIALYQPTQNYQKSQFIISASSALFWNDENFVEKYCIIKQTLWET